MANKKLAALIVFGLMFLIAASAHADRNILFTGFEFTKKHPRALGMGNAFVALSHTAETAVKYNPAGLAHTYDDDYYVEASVLIAAGVRQESVNFINDAEDVSGTSDANIIDDFVGDYEDDTQGVFAAVDTTLAYRSKVESLSWIQRYGVGLFYHAGVVGTGNFPVISDSAVDITGKTSEQIAEEVADELERQSVFLSDAEIDQLAAEIEDLDESEVEAFQNLVNRMVQRGISYNAYALESRGAALAVSTLDDNLKLGMNFKSYRLSHYSLDSQPIGEAVATELDLLDAGQDENSTASGFDFGATYEFREWMEGWVFRTGALWTNAGGVEFSEEIDVALTDTLNLGFAAEKEYGIAKLLLSLDIHDVTGNWNRFDTDGDKIRHTFTQRTHFGMEIGLWENGDMDNRYVYLRTGSNQGQGTYGVELALPYDILRVGYVGYGEDLGDEDQDDVVQNVLFYMAGGFTI